MIPVKFIFMVNDNVTRKEIRLGYGVKYFAERNSDGNYEVYWKDKNGRMTTNNVEYEIKDVVELLRRNDWIILR